MAVTTGAARAKSNAAPSAPSVATTNFTGSAAAATASARTIPFVRSAREHEESGETRSVQLSTSVQTIPFRVPVYGYARSVVLKVDVAASGNSATVAMQPDAPWALIANATLKDASGTPLWNLDGYGLYAANLYGGYNTWRLDGGDGYTAPTTGSGATAGSFSYYISFPLEFAREGIGAIPNMDGNSPMFLDLLIAPSSAVYSTAPTVLPTVTVQILLSARDLPMPSDQFGNATTTVPPAMGTLQFWSSTTFAVQTGSNVWQLPRVGNLIRNWILVFRNASGARADLITSGLFQLTYDQRPVIQLPIGRLYMNNYQYYGFNRLTGVLPIPFTSDPDGVPGREYGDKWMPTLNASRIEFRFDATTAGVLTLYTNDIVPSGNIFAQ